ncbi:MAG: hypothetical protein EBS35_07420, partial [Bacteroidetes bacterium]|nr:hypothetical protein [Bacteroidota bacterium]
MWLHAKVLMGEARAVPTASHTPTYSRSASQRPYTPCHAVQIDAERDLAPSGFNAKAERSAYDPKYRYDIQTVSTEHSHHITVRLWPPWPL